MAPPRRSRSHYVSNWFFWLSDLDKLLNADCFWVRPQLRNPLSASPPALLTRQRRTKRQPISRASALIAHSRVRRATGFLHWLYRNRAGFRSRPSQPSLALTLPIQSYHFARSEMRIGRHSNPSGYSLVMRWIWPFVLSVVFDSGNANLSGGRSQSAAFGSAEEVILTLNRLPKYICVQKR